MKLLLLLSLMSLVSCATKYVVPGNRFITPESQGGALRGQFEFQNTQAHQMTIDTSQGTIDEGVTYEEIPRTGYLLSSSLFENLDLIWSHTGSANSMLGAKLQFLGASRTGNATGHKMALAGLFGSNKHETEDKAVEFILGGQELLLLYGYRITENFLPYISFSYSKYNFEGQISSAGSPVNGAEPSIETTIKAMNGGVEFNYELLFAKIECSYQQIASTDTKEKEGFLVGYSFGLNW